jgi:hypothetical protein
MGKEDSGGGWVVSRRTSSLTLWALTLSVQPERRKGNTSTGCCSAAQTRCWRSRYDETQSLR